MSKGTSQSGVPKALRNKIIIVFFLIFATITYHSAHLVQHHRAFNVSQRSEANMSTAIAPAGSTESAEVNSFDRIKVTDKEDSEKLALSLQPVIDVRRFI